MRPFIFVLLSVSLLNGCALFSSAKHENQSQPVNYRSRSFNVQLADSSSGRVAVVNPNFVVLTFPFGIVPGLGQHMNVYRDGKKVGELKITGPQRDINTVADIVSGEAQIDDEARTD